MRELGGILRATRESLGLDLDEIESRTKIRKRYLVALEEGDWSLLPGRVYARGFVRSYAEVLGLDGLDLLQKHVDGRDMQSDEASSPESQLTEGSNTSSEQNAQPSSADAEKQKPVAKPQEPRAVRSDPPIFSTGSRPKAGPTRPRVNGPIVQTAVIVAALVVVGGGYFAIHRHSHTSPQTNMVASNANVASTANQTSNSGAVVSSNTTVVPKNATENTTTSTNSTPPKPAVVITPHPLQNGLRTYTVQNVSSLTVELKVTSGQLWLSATADGKVVNGNDTVNTGGTRSYTGGQSVLLDLGHVQGIQITVNGKVLPLPNVQNPVKLKIVKQ